MHSNAGYRNAGVSVYARNLVAQLLGGHADEHDYVVFCNSDFDARSLPELGSARLIHSPFPGSKPWLRIGWEQTGLPLAAKRAGVEVLHGLLNVSPPLSGCRQVLTIHDLSFITTPQAHPWRRRAYMKVACARSARRASAILVDSRATGKDVAAHFGIAGERVIVAYPGLADGLGEVNDPAKLARFRRDRGLPERFLLFLGTIEPRKNLDRLIAAFARMRRQGYPGWLVLAGGHGWGNIDLSALARNAGVADRVIVPGYVVDREKQMWYSAAEAFVYPSIYEGFGLPVLEALACGTPVAVANSSSLPEVSGNAGILFDPNNIDSITAALVQICNDPPTAATLRAQGPLQARRFTWQKTAQGALLAYQRALET